MTRLERSNSLQTDEKTCSSRICRLITTVYCKYFLCLCRLNRRWRYYVCGCARFLSVFCLTVMLFQLHALMLTLTFHDQCDKRHRRRHTLRRLAYSYLCYCVGGWIKSLKQRPYRKPLSKVRLFYRAQYDWQIITPTSYMKRYTATQKICKEHIHNRLPGAAAPVESFQVGGAYVEADNNFCPWRVSKIVAAMRYSHDLAVVYRDGGSAVQWWWRGLYTRKWKTSTSATDVRWRYGRVWLESGY